MEFIKLAIKVISVIVAVLVLFVALGLGLEWHYRTPLEKFCGSIGFDSSPKMVWNAAKESEFFVFPYKENEEWMAILNHKSFVFRYQCGVTFKNGKYSAHKFISAD